MRPYLYEIAASFPAAICKDIEMSGDVIGARAQSAGHPLFRILAAFPIACFCGALATDIAYAETADMMWADFSAWLLAVGLAIGVLAAIVGLVALISRRREHTARTALPLVLGSLVVLGLAFLNNLVHSRDAWTSVVPMGLVLSAVTVIVMLVTVWLGSPRVGRDRVIVQYPGVRP